MSGYVLHLSEVDGKSAALAGGKAAHLAELSRIEGIRVPAGFCVTTEAFRRFMPNAASLDDRLARLTPRDGAAIRALCGELSGALDGVALPNDVAAAIT